MGVLSAAPGRTQRFRQRRSLWASLTESALGELLRPADFAQRSCAGPSCGCPASRGAP